ncbi:hypothetical protein OG444_03835 [Streptomyces sp. NBC_01232]|uniref:hypothetical protein n=1 Tax=unclassified Streptomyces TaxID=2593676 RepID=UPI002E0E8CCA|nr:hypothetical protein OG444_03835 [Streptomyces sp. NBC_01232]
MTAALMGGLVLGGCSGAAGGPTPPAAEKAGTPTASPDAATASPSPSVSQPAAPEPSDAVSPTAAGSKPSPSHGSKPAPKRSTAGSSKIPQNPYRGPNPPPAPTHVPTLDWKPSPFDPKDPSIPKYTLPPLP